MTERFSGAARIVLFAAILLLLGSACGLRPPAGDPPQEAENFAPAQLRLWAAEDGLYQVTSAELAKNGLDLGDALSYESIRLSSGGEPVPYLLRDEALVFYGRASDSRYYRARPYLLEVGQPGREIAKKSLEPAAGPPRQQVRQTIRLEENNEYISEARDGDGQDLWFWSRIPQQSAFDAEFTLPAAPLEGTAALRLNLWGFTHNPQVENDHDLAIWVNDQAAGSLAFDGQVHYTGELAVPAAALQAGANKITLDNRPEGASFLDIVQLNWLELAYPTAAAAVDDRLDFIAEEGRLQISGFSERPTIVDLADAAEPLLLEGWQYENGLVDLPLAAGMPIAAAAANGYLTPQIGPVLLSTWRSAENQADLIIVTTAALAPALEPLAAAREEEGLRTAVVPVEAIYDEFGYGAPSPDSIRSFVAHAYEEWQTPRPRYLLLVGDATSDYLGYAHALPPNNVPSLMVPVAFSGETVSDSQIADVDGDGHPDLAVGRWPVGTAREVEALVTRTLAYEANPARERAVFATDGTDLSFSRMARDLAQDGELPADQVEQRDGPSAEEIGDLLGEGAWLATYIGHGSIDRWGKEDIFNLQELEKLESASSPPIMLQLTCLTGLFAHPQQLSLAEGMLLHPSGPVLIVAASSLTYSHHQEPFAAELIRQLQNEETIRAGDAFLAAKQALPIENSDGVREISDTFALFGDPSAKITRP